MRRAKEEDGVVMGEERRRTDATRGCVKGEADSEEVEEEEEEVFFCWV